MFHSRHKHAAAATTAAVHRLTVDKSGARKREPNGERQILLHWHFCVPLTNARNFGCIFCLQTFAFMLLLMRSSFEAAACLANWRLLSFAPSELPAAQRLRSIRDAKRRMRPLTRTFFVPKKRALLAASDAQRSR